MSLLREVSAVFRKPVFFTVAALLATANWQSARADNEPLLRPDGSIAYRDWGLYRPGVPVLIEGPYIYYGRRFGDRAYYFPSNRRDPNAYRSPPPAGKPVPAEPWYRSWGSHSDFSAPVTAPASDAAVTLEGPSVMYAPNSRRRHRHHGDEPGKHHGDHH